MRVGGAYTDIIRKLEKMIEMGCTAEGMRVELARRGFECSEFSDPENEIPKKFH